MLYHQQPIYSDSVRLQSFWRSSKSLARLHNVVNVRYRACCRGGDMDSGRALTLLDQMLWNSLIVAAPILLSILIIGVMVSIFQVTTQLQEMTLSYVPKILAVAFLLILIGPWMMARVTQFSTSVYLLIPTLSR